MILEIVLKTFQKYRLVLNPKKCKFGLREIEYVGHTLDKIRLKNI